MPNLTTVSSNVSREKQNNSNSADIEKLQQQLKDIKEQVNVLKI